MSTNKLFKMDLQLFAGTKIADVIVPEVFNPYVISRTTELSALYQSGIISHNPELDKLASSGGILINMPFWEDLNGDDEILDDNKALTPDKITAGKDIARLHARGKAWGVNDLAKALSGDDPMKAIGDLVADYWARRWQVMLLSTLKGVFASDTMKSNVHDISGEATNNTFAGETFIDALHKLGDAENKLTAVAVHSMTYAAMRKLNLIEFIPDSNGVVNIPTYMGKRVIVDDGMPFDTVTKTATTYIFGQGAIGYGEGAAPVPTETDRDSLAGEDYLINRRHFILHPRGVKWNEIDVAGKFPTNAEIATATNWTRVYDPKHIRIVKFVHKLG